MDFLKNVSKKSWILVGVALLLGLVIGVIAPETVNMLVLKSQGMF